MKMFRKRFIPDEIVDISKDEVIKRTANYLVTKWLPIHPRDDVASGLSYVYFDEGYKISKFFDKNGELLYYYCDIIDYNYDEKNDIFTFIDLLVDIKYYPDGKLEFLDFDELQKAYDEGLIDSSMLLKAINNLNKLVKKIENNSFFDLI